MSIGRFDVVIRERIISWHVPDSDPVRFEVPSVGTLNSTDMARFVQVRYGIEGALNTVIQDVLAILRAGGRRTRKDMTGLKVNRGGTTGGHPAFPKASGKVTADIAWKR